MFVRIEPSSGIPIIRQIADQIRTQCASNVLKPGDRIPSVRELAAQLAVNPNTILHVYERLTLEGILERRHGEGTFVAQALPSNQLAQQKELFEADARRLVEKARTLGITPDELHNMIDTLFQSQARQPRPTRKETIR